MMKIKFKGKTSDGFAEYEIENPEMCFSSDKDREYKENCPKYESEKLPWEK